MSKLILESGLLSNPWNENIIIAVQEIDGPSDKMRAKRNQ